MDTEEGFDRLAEALISIDEGISLQEGTKYSTKLDTSIYQTLPKAMEMYEAYEMQTEAVPFSQTVGRTSGAFVYLYPPGIPLVVPGEIINEKLVGDVRKALELGMEVDGLCYDDNADKYSFVTVHT